MFEYSSKILASEENATNTVFKRPADFFFLFFSDYRNLILLPTLSGIGGAKPHPALQLA